jgi:hypothetical protein
VRNGVLGMVGYFVDAGAPHLFARTEFFRHFDVPFGDATARDKARATRGTTLMPLGWLRHVRRGRQAATRRDRKAFACARSSAAKDRSERVKQSAIRCRALSVEECGDWAKSAAIIHWTNFGTRSVIAGRGRIGILSLLGQDLTQHLYECSDRPCVLMGIGPSPAETRESR